jgi:hypothetical protein
MGRDYLGELDIDRRKTLKWILNAQSLKVRTELKWLRMRFSSENS